MMLSPMLRFKGAIAALLLLGSADVSSATSSITMSQDVKVQRAFISAMEPETAYLRDNEAARKGRFLQNIMANARPRNGRQLDAGADYSSFGFDMTQYSLKYAGCSAIAMYSDDLAESEYAPTVLQSMRFVVLRLCPSQHCNKYAVTGCSSDYGEYVLEMEDYLNAVNDYNVDKLDQFCTYCANCYAAQEAAAEEAAAAAADGDDAAAAEGDDAAAAADDAADAGNGRRLEEDACATPCGDYADTCAATSQLPDYFACTKVTGSDGTDYYVAPHCGSDLFTISIGVYSEQTCSTYVGDSVTLSDLGLELSNDDMLAYSPKDCVSCQESSSEWEQAGGDADDSDGVDQLCESLYEGGAKCNKHFTSTLSTDAYYTSQQQENEEMVCNFIKNVVSGTYDESGEIVVSAWNFNVSEWNQPDAYINQYKQAKRAVSTPQILGLVISMAACLVMTVWACCLHGSLSRKNLPWRPRRGQNSDPTAISRQNSGIVMGRSRSQMNSPLV